ncbi:hypothetical protein [Chitinophaga nivalis]|uniref:DUF4827 domain-containing protein n=1 Tax=Chitinophaga nivalis TaxID=2991709 RepID=A0ABT3IQ35_9BACT|nr:hypothetical protein [Chitinophaga nivalis]MCW3464221.1 hypothetical protein [Chitinophaga nivalis]MCW3486089.1 hypothetical protein [Chitinophaga nivalis]
MKKIYLLMVALAAITFSSCKKEETLDQTKPLTEEAYKAKLEKLIHLTPETTSGKSAAARKAGSSSAFKTYKEAYEAFSFLEDGGKFVVTTEFRQTKGPAVNTTAKVPVSATGGLFPGDDPYEDTQTVYWRAQTKATAQVKNTFRVSQLDADFIWDFTVVYYKQLTGAWRSEITVTKRGQPNFAYGGLGILDVGPVEWVGDKFIKSGQGHTTIGGVEASFIIRIECSVTVGGTVSPSVAPSLLAKMTAVAM